MAGKSKMAGNPKMNKPHQSPKKQPTFTTGKDKVSLPLLEPEREETDQELASRQLLSELEAAAEEGCPTKGKEKEKESTSDDRKQETAPK